MSDALRAAIRRVEDWRNKTPAQIHAELIAVTHQKKPPDERIWSIAGIARVFGVSVAESIYAALNASSLPGIATRFAATGLDTTDPQWLSNADALIAGPLSRMPPETQQSLKWIGHREVQLWSDELTEADVDAALSQVRNQQRLTNAKALFHERMTLTGDAAAVWSKAWTDAEVV